MSSIDPSVINCDVLIVGGGVAGSSLGAALAGEGLGVVIVEREAEFRDRVRGEGIVPWGVHEADKLGLLPILRSAGALESTHWSTYSGKDLASALDMTTISPDGHGAWNIYHPDLQAALIEHAEHSGATILRPAKAVSVGTSKPYVVIIENGDQETTVSARLIVGADGRTSVVRRWAGIETTRDPVHHRVGGCLLSNVNLDNQSIHQGNFNGGFSLVFPQREGRARTYIACDDDMARGLMGVSNRHRFIEQAASSLPLGALAEAELSGPVAFFPNADIWTSEPATNGFALIGDAAGANDPTIGQGLSLTLRDARELRDLLLDSVPRSPSSDSWNLATTEYAKRRTRYFETVRTFAQWFAMIRVDHGPEAEDRLRKIMLAREADPSSGEAEIIPFRGPDGIVLDEDARQRFFGEDLLQ